MALGRRGNQGFCDNTIETLLLKSLTMGGGFVKNYQKQRNVIYGRTLTCCQTSVFTSQSLRKQCF
jgi:hypothetical protein